MTSFQFRKFLGLRMPIAYIAGVHLQSLDNEKCTTRVRLSRWNQNPFRSMFWAVQGMAAELSTGVICLNYIQQSGENVSMLVIQQEAEFYKKAVGRIEFECVQAKEIHQSITKAIETGESVVLKVKSIGTDCGGNEVSAFWFTWSFKNKI